MLETCSSLLFWLLLFRVFVFDGLCFIPTNPLSWILTHVGRIAKHNLKGRAYQTLSYYFDSEITPIIWILLIFTIILQRKAKKPAKKVKLPLWKWLVIISAPFILLHRGIVLHNHREILHSRLDNAFPSPIGHELIEDIDDHIDSDSLVSIHSTFGIKRSILRNLYLLEHSSVYSLTKALFNHFGSQENLPHSHIHLFKEFEPRNISNCENEIYRYLGVSILSDSRKNLDLGRLYMEFYEPRKNPKNIKLSPVVLFVHGGGWRGGDKRVFESNFLGGGLHGFLLNNGISVAAISYRLLCTGANGYDMVEDIRDAVLYLKDNYRTFGIDPDRIVLIGSSAGAHLSLLTSLRVPELNLRGVISLYGPIECREELLSSNNMGVYERLNNYFFVRQFHKLCIGQEKKQCLEDMSVTANVPKCENSKCPPVLLLHGHNDPIVPIAQAYMLVKELNRYDVRNALIDVPCSSHDCDIICSSVCSQASLFGIERFLNNVLV